MMVVHECEQGSPEWHAVRLGRPTASMFHVVCRTKGRGADGESKTRTEYLHKLAGEIMSGELMENFVSSAMQDGIDQEPDAREFYAFAENVELRRVGFISLERYGCSPDSLIGDDGGLEIKIAKPHVQSARWDRKHRGAIWVEPQHFIQVQGNLFITGRKWWDLMSYCKRFPPLIERMYPDAEFQASLNEQLALFTNELDQHVAYMQRQMATGALAA